MSNIFNSNPISLDIRRSRFDLSHKHKTSFNVGELIPTLCVEVYPGDTFKIDLAQVVRSETPLHQSMDDAYIDQRAFFVPLRLLWDHASEFFGENTTGPWTQSVEYTIPQLILANNKKGADEGSLVDYFGLPTKTEYGAADSKSYLSVNALPFRAYVKIWNDWYRDENTMSPAYFYTGDSPVNFVPRGSDGPAEALTHALYGGRPLQVSKFKDYFTSALPQPQKGDPVSIPVSGFGQTRIPVRTPYDSVNETYDPLQFSIDYSDEPDGYAGFAETTPVGTFNLVGLTAAGSDAAIPLNLGMDPSSLQILVNDLRLAVQLQKWSEAAARNGTRYTEIIRGMFGVQSPDARLQRSEYLGGFRQSLSVTQVVQTSATDNTSPQGNVAAYSKTIGTGHLCSKSFTEHGYLLVLACVRTDHTYQSTIGKMWSRKRRFDLYWPQLANIGETAILRKERFVPDDWTQLDDPDNVAKTLNGAFGYQEAWAELRQMPSFVSGNFRSNSSYSLDVWTYADDPDDSDYDAVINQDFVWETAENFGRTLAVQSGADQIFADFGFIMPTVRPMPLRSIPGLLDHH